VLRKALNCSDCPSELFPLLERPCYGCFVPIQGHIAWKVQSRAGALGGSKDTPLRQSTGAGKDRDLEAKAGTLLKTEKLFEKSMRRLAHFSRSLAFEL